ncbi:MAG: Com family DNA-binding transcriptional regulator [Polaromonas sp.]
MYTAGLAYQISPQEKDLQKLNEIRCGACTRKLGTGLFTHLVIKCPRCGVMNTLRAQSPTPERHERLSPESATHENKSNHSVDGRQASAG